MREERPTSPIFYEGKGCVSFGSVRFAWYMDV